MFVLSPAAMAWTPTDAARAYAFDVKEAMRLANIDQKAAAITMGITESLLSDQLNCRNGKQLSASRLADLPPAFHDALRDLQAARSGAVVLKADLVTLLRGAAALPRKMLRASIGSAPHSSRRSA